MFVSPEQRAMPPAFNYAAFDLPTNVEMTFKLNPHDGPDDLPEERVMSAEIKRADAFIDELITNHDDKATLASISKGDQKTYLLWRNALIRDGNPMQAHTAKIFSALFASRTPATTIDVDSDTHITALNQPKLEYRYARVIHDARSNTDVIQAAPVQREIYKNLQTRDQIILENTKPEIDALSARHPKLAAVRQSRQAKFLLYYGSAHRSLVDALTYKNTQSPTEGFSAQIHPDSDIDNFDEQQYALFLRGEAWPDELLIIDAGLRYVYPAVKKRQVANGQAKNPFNDNMKIATQLVYERGVADDYLKMRSLALDIHAGRVAIPSSHE